MNCTDSFSYFSAKIYAAGTFRLVPHHGTSDGYVHNKCFHGKIRKTFVCVEVLRLSQPNGVMSSTVSLPNHTFTGQV